MSAPVTSERSTPSSITPIDIQRAVTERWYIRPNDVVERTGLSKSKVFAALYSGELRGFRRGKSWLIPVEELRRWVEGDAA